MQKAKFTHPALVGGISLTIAGAPNKDARGLDGATGDAAGHHL